jgi:hypothetical protein
VVGEVSGMAIATALGLGDLASIVLAVALAFFFGYSLTSLPLLRARLRVACGLRQLALRLRLCAVVLERESAEFPEEDKAAP